MKAGGPVQAHPLLGARCGSHHHAARPHVCRMDPYDPRGGLRGAPPAATPAATPAAAPAAMHRTLNRPQATCGVAWSIYVIVRQVLRPPHALRPAVPALMPLAPSTEHRAPSPSPSPSPSRSPSRSPSPSAPSANPSAPTARLGASTPSSDSIRRTSSASRTWSPWATGCTTSTRAAACQSGHHVRGSGEGLHHRSPRSQARRWPAPPPASRPEPCFVARIQA